MSGPDPAKLKLLEAILCRAAEDVGDLTVPAMTLFYDRHPQAREVFERHGAGKREALEAEMVENALYSVMTWLERPTEIAIMFYGSVPHHRQTLQVGPDWYRGLIDSVIDVVAGTVPACSADEVALVREISAGLQAIIAEATG